MDYPDVYIDYYVIVRNPDYESVDGIPLPPYLTPIYRTKNPIF